MLSQIPMELVAVHLGFAEHSLGTSAFEEYMGYVSNGFSLFRLQFNCNFGNMKMNLRFLGAFAKFAKSVISFVMSDGPPSWNDWAHIGRIFMKFDI